MTRILIGVDVCKNCLDAHVRPVGAKKQFAHDPAGIDQFVAWVAPFKPERILFELANALLRNMTEASEQADTFCKESSFMILVWPQERPRVIADVRATKAPVTPDRALTRAGIGPVKTF